MKLITGKTAERKLVQPDLPCLVKNKVISHSIQYQKCREPAPLGVVSVFLYHIVVMAFYNCQNLNKATGLS